MAFFPIKRTVKVHAYHTDQLNGQLVLPFNFRTALLFFVYLFVDGIPAICYAGCGKDQRWESWGNGMTIDEQGSFFKPVATKRVSQVIYDQIYQKIVSGELRPGHRLPSERELAEQFRRSRPSVREALRMLQQDGLLEISVGSAGGAVIRGISLETVEEPLRKLVAVGAINLNELVEYRHINDRGCARLAAIHYTEKDAKALQKILDGAKNSIQEPISFQEYDIAFHSALAQASHNALAQLINDVIVGLNTRVFREAILNYTPEQYREINRLIYESHNAIFQAVLSRNSAEADHCVDIMVDLFWQQVQQGSPSAVPFQL